MQKLFNVPLVLSPQPEGGFTVTSPVLPELITEGDTVDKALGNVQDAITAALEIYDDEGRPLPGNLLQDSQHDSILIPGCNARLRSRIRRNH
ncbi:MAG: type II toxin-antitoxin system HicB family antitoxin [Candidatus Hydrogenedentes bacterium]|nr:type II toxin-antitoxin system HicB family antitoxin [Candidatus Hydrogenedentota bacterium]